MASGPLGCHPEGQGALLSALCLLGGQRQVTRGTHGSECLTSDGRLRSSQDPIGLVWDRAQGLATVGSSHPPGWGSEIMKACGSGRSLAWMGSLYGAEPECMISLPPTGSPAWDGGRGRRGGGCELTEAVSALQLPGLFHSPPPPEGLVWAVGKAPVTC